MTTLPFEPDKRNQSFPQSFPQSTLSTHSDELPVFSLYKYHSTPIVRSVQASNAGCGADERLTFDLASLLACWVCTEQAIAPSPAYAPVFKVIDNCRPKKTFCCKWNLARTPYSTDASTRSPAHFLHMNVFVAPFRSIKGHCRFGCGNLDARSWKNICTGSWGDLPLVSVVWVTLATSTLLEADDYEMGFASPGDWAPPPHPAPNRPNSPPFVSCKDANPACIDPSSRPLGTPSMLNWWIPRGAAGSASPWP